MQSTSLGRKARGAALLLLAGAPALANVGLLEPNAFPALADEPAATDVALADLDGNGTPEIYLSFGNRTAAGGIETPVRDRMLINKGGAFFFDSGLALDTAAPQTGVAVALADFDGDGLVDAAIAGGAAFDGSTQMVSPSRLYRNLGSGNLVDAGTFGSATARTAIAVADVDGDLDIDVVLVDAGGVDLLRNVGVPGSGSFSFAAAQRLDLVGADLRGAVFGQFAGDARRDLAVLRGSGPAGVRVLTNVGGATPFALGPAIDAAGAPNDLAAGDLDGNGFDDLVIAATTPDGALESATRIVLVGAAGLVESAFRFPAQSHVAVAIGDLDGQDQPDIVLARQRCGGFGCAGPDSSTLAVWRATAGSYVHNGQCLGRQSLTDDALVLARLDGDAAFDALLLGSALPEDPGSIGTSVFLNDAPPLAGQCCLAQLAAEFGESVPTAFPWRLARAAAAIDLDAYSAVRDELMADALNGARLRARYLQFSPEIVPRMLLDPTLWDDAAQVLTAWSAPLRALVDGDGGQATVSAAMVDGVDALLQRFASGGSPALAQAIAEERALLPPFASFVGLTMDEFRDLTLPRDTLLRDGFESEP